LEGGERGRGRGRGRGAGRGGRGRGGPPPVAEMTASGPFAMGPALFNSSGRAAPRANAVMPPSGAAGSHGASLSGSAAPTIKRENDLKGKQAEVQREEDDYSDPDEGVEIIDLHDVRQMDWMAPESLKREQKRVKKEDPNSSLLSVQMPYKC
jgi:DNA-directed RNA polymerase III subunit RPC4